MKGHDSTLGTGTKPSPGDHAAACCRLKDPVWQRLLPPWVPVQVSGLPGTQSLEQDSSFLDKSQAEGFFKNINQCLPLTLVFPPLL